MASLIKNQIFKHLSRFAKNLSTDKLQLTLLRGQCELQNLELDERVLMDLLELPPWLYLSQAVCNHVTLKIQWTKLKSVPIYLALDEVYVEMETCEELRPSTPQSSHLSYRSGGKYGFSDRVIDGMTVGINSVVIKFKSPAFHASFQLTRLLLESRTPRWKKADLRLTRVKDSSRGEVLIFKHLEWQMLRIEAKATASCLQQKDGTRLPEIVQTPLRLITNQATCRIVIKKRLSDCVVLGARIVFRLEDLLWVLTDAQLLAAFHFLNSLNELIQKTPVVKKIPTDRQDDHMMSAGFQQKSSGSESAVSQLFNQYDVIETSFHIYMAKIDIHLCDDLDPKDGRSHYYGLDNGGALKVTLSKLILDFYPYHLALGSRSHWMMYKEPSSGRNIWAQQLLQMYQENILSSLHPEAMLSKHVSANDSSPTQEQQQQHQRRDSIKSTHSRESKSRRSSSIRSTAPWSLKQLLSRTLILRIEEFAIHGVTTSSGPKQQLQTKFISSDRSSFSLPEDMNAVHLEFTSFYSAHGQKFPVPNPTLFVHLGPLKLLFDAPTMLWLNAFCLNLHKAVEKLAIMTASTKKNETTNIRIEALMPQLVLPADMKAEFKDGFPKSLEFKASRVIATNTQLNEQGTQVSLNQFLESMGGATMLYETDKYPWLPDDFPPFTDKFMQHLQGEDNCFHKLETKVLSSSMEVLSESAESVKKKGSLCLSAEERHAVWSVQLDPCWGDFRTGKEKQHKLHTFVDPLPITAWIYIVSKTKPYLSALTQQVSSQSAANVVNGIDKVSDTKGSCDQEQATVNGEDAKKEGDIQVLIHVPSTLKLQMSHKQYVFTMDVMERLTEFSVQLMTDTVAIQESEEASSICLTTMLPAIEISLILNQFTQPFKFEMCKVLDVHSSLNDVTQVGSGLSSSSPISPSDPKLSPLDEFVDNPIKEEANLDDSANGTLPKSCSDSLINSQLLNSCPSDDLTVSGASSHSDRLVHTVEKSSATFQKTLQSGTQVMKKGFSNIMAGFDSVITKGSLSSDSPVDSELLSPSDEDTRSIRSDFSADSDQFIMVGMEGVGEEDDFFGRRGTTSADVEMADEVTEESGEEDLNKKSLAKQVMVSVLTLKMKNVEFFQQSIGPSSAILLRSQQLETVEHPLLSWEEFQSLFTARFRSSQGTGSSHTSPDAQISLRLESKYVQGSSQKDDYLTTIAQNIILHLSNKTAAALGSFFTDDVKASITPMKAVINNFKMFIKDEGHTEGNNSNSLPPLHMNVPGFFIERTAENEVQVLPLELGGDESLLSCLPSSKIIENCTFPRRRKESSNGASVSDVLDGNNFTTSNTNIHPLPIEKENENESGIDLDTLLDENMKLKRQLLDLERVEHENKILKRQLEVIKAVYVEDQLRTQLLNTQDDVRRLEEEKSSLLATLQLLKEEVQRLEREKPKKDLTYLVMR